MSAHSYFYDESAWKASTLIIMDKQIFNIEGMKCGACAFTIQKNIQRLKGVKHVFVNFNKRELKVDYDHKKISATEIIQSVAPFGYMIQPSS